MGNDAIPHVFFNSPTLSTKKVKNKITIDTLLYIKNICNFAG